jgi:hypothetical protein
LKDVIALQNPQVLNTITIEEGSYVLKANYSKEAILVLKSNLNLIINGTITLEPNAFDAYMMIHIKDQDHINISGSGSVIGDKDTHLGTTGQHGHGIFVQGSFVTIKDITVNNCWGDTICIGKSNSQVLNVDHIIVDNCYLDNSRRQGISITHGSHITIRNCHITNIGGHNPQAGIDIEPNKGGNFANNILIENCRVENCTIGIVIYGRSYYQKSCISINNCYIQCLRRAIAVNGVNASVQVTNCEIYTRFHVVDANTTYGTIDNVILFENNIINQHPEEGDDMSTDSRGCAIYAIKGDYCFRHNSIICTLPVFRFASGNKFIEDNDIECNNLFFTREFSSVKITGNHIKGNVTIPGPRTIFADNTVNGLLKSTESYTVIKDGQTITVEINDKDSVIRNNFITNVVEGNDKVEFRKRVIVDGNRFNNIAFTMHEGVVSNNRITYNDRFTITGILLNLGYCDFVNNLVNYNGTHGDSDNIYLIRTVKSIIGNEVIASSKVKYVFYPGGDGCYIIGNKVTLPANEDPGNTSSITNNRRSIILPAVATFGTSDEKPTLTGNEKYYIGCTFFDTQLGKPLWWNGTNWVDSTGAVVN